MTDVISSQSYVTYQDLFLFVLVVIFSVSFVFACVEFITFVKVHKNKNKKDNTQNNVNDSFVSKKEFDALMFSKEYYKKHLDDVNTEYNNLEEKCINLEIDYDRLSNDYDKILDHICKIEDVFFKFNCSYVENSNNDITLILFNELKNVIHEDY